MIMIILNGTTDSNADSHTNSTTTITTTTTTTTNNNNNNTQTNIDVFETHVSCQQGEIQCCF